MLVEVIWETSADKSASLMFVSILFMVSLIFIVALKY